MDVDFPEDDDFENDAYGDEERQQEDDDGDESESDLLGLPLDGVEASLVDSMLMPPPPPTTAARATSTTTVQPAAAAAAAAAPPQLPRVSRPQSGADTSVRRLRVNDVHVDLAPSVKAATANGVKHESGAPAAVVVPLGLDHYNVAQRLAAEQRAAELAVDGGGGDGGGSKVGDTAAQVNHYLIAISEARSRVDPAILSQLPYGVETSGAHIGRSFYMQALTTAPHMSRPVSEMTDIMRRLASEVKCVRREHIEAQTRTPRLREEVCANRDGCVALSFCDYYNRPLPERRPLVAFLFEDELAVLRTGARAAPTGACTPAAAASAAATRAALAATWKTRACVQCMIKGGNRLLTNLRCKNQAIDARPYLAIPFYVEVDVAGQYPIGATLGPGKRVFESLIFNLPRFSELGWMAMMRGDATTTAGATAGAAAAAATSAGGGDDVVHYHNVSVPPFPVPQETLRAHMAQGFSAAL